MLVALGLGGDDGIEVEDEDVQSRLLLSVLASTGLSEHPPRIRSEELNHVHTFIVPHSRSSTVYTMRLIPYNAAANWHAPQGRAMPTPPSLMRAT